jgi:hypothetical protein
MMSEDQVRELRKVVLNNAYLTKKKTSWFGRHVGMKYALTMGGCRLMLETIDMILQEKGEKGHSETLRTF